MIKYKTKNFYDGSEKEFICKQGDLYELVKKEDIEILNPKGKLLGGAVPLEVIRGLARSSARFIKTDLGRHTGEILVSRHKIENLLKKLNKTPEQNEKLIALNYNTNQIYITPKVIEIR